MQRCEQHVSLLVAKQLLKRKKFLLTGAENLCRGRDTWLEGMKSPHGGPLLHVSMTA